MRNSRNRGSNRRTGPPLLAAPGAETIQPHIQRSFRPDEIDVDDLAEAIRVLLGRNGSPRTDSRNLSDPDLLFLAPRVSHVVEANKAT
jgi:hypothetical protein